MQFNYSFINTFLILNVHILMILSVHFLQISYKLVHFIKTIKIVKVATYIYKHEYHVVFLMNLFVVKHADWQYAHV